MASTVEKVAKVRQCIAKVMAVQYTTGQPVEFELEALRDSVVEAMPDKDFAYYVIDKFLRSGHFISDEEFDEIEEILNDIGRDIVSRDRTLAKDLGL
jgi:aconitase A